MQIDSIVVKVRAGLAAKRPFYVVGDTAMAEKRDIFRNLGR
jgi:hypothetical protein